MKRSVRDLMNQKSLGIGFPSTQIGASVKEALEVLEKFNSGSLLVLSGDRLAGLFSERDFARKSLRASRLVDLSTPVEELMIKKVYFVTESYRLEECLAVMEQLHVRHLPVMQGDCPIALLSMRHIMEALIEDREFMIGELVSYVTGSGIREKFEKPKPLVKSSEPRLNVGIKTPP